jgi:hypothetical protein
MGRGRTKDREEPREESREQDRKAEETYAKEIIQDIKENNNTTIPDANDTTNNTSSNEIGVKVNDRSSSPTNNQSRDRPERPKEDIKAYDKTEQEIKESLQRDIIYLRDAIYPHWQAFLNALGSPRNWFLTKEDFELVKSYFSQVEANIHANVMEYLRKASDDPCSVHKSLQFITIRKLGTIQIQAYKNRIDAILQAIQYQSQMYQTVAQSLAQVVQSFTNSYILQSGLSQFEIPNIVQDLKAVSVIGILTASLTSIGIEIGNLKNNLRSLIRFNEFCIRPCRPDCRDTIPISNIVGINKIVEHHINNEYNEGIEFGNESEIFLEILEKLANLELEYLQQQIKEGKLDIKLDINNRKRKNNNNG